MNKMKPQLPKGMRDFLPVDMLRRQYVINTIEEIFQHYGYEPFQTPVLELASSLMGKYGEDAEKLIYYAQHPNSDDRLALRYDLTVPLVRAFAQHEAELTLPFKRYQIAPVWRAERPQRGRFREFFQCDADTVGVPTVDADAEAVAVGVAILHRLGIKDFVVKLNDRRLLTGIGQYAGLEGEALANLYRSIDKLDKIGVDGVRNELVKTGQASVTVDKIMGLIGSAQAGSGYESGRRSIDTIYQIMPNSAEAQAGLTALGQMLTYLQAMHVPAANIDLDFSMVRGLSYYTGPIFEYILQSDNPEERVGSVGSGGRYDDLMGIFRKETLPIVGVSMGIERLIVILEERKAYPTDINQTVVQVLVGLFNADMKTDSLALAGELRQAGLRTELFMQDNKSIGKQLSYAEGKGIPLVAILGPDEQTRGVVKLKRIADRQEFTVPRDEVVRTAAHLLNLA